MILCLKIKEINSFNQINCKYFTSKSGWDESSHYCIDESKTQLTSLDQCQIIEIKKPFPFGYVWFYCYPDKNNLKIYYRIEIKSCLGYESLYKSGIGENKYYNAIKRGINYDKHCTRPEKFENNTFTFRTICNQTPIEFDFKDYIVFKNNHLECFPL